MALYSERKRARELAEREAAGENVFAKSLTDRARGRIARLADQWLFKTSFAYAAKAVEMTEGMREGEIEPDFDGVDACLREAHHDLACALIEALIEAEDHHPAPDYGSKWWFDDQEGLTLDFFYDCFKRDVDEVLRSEKIAMRLVDNELIDFDSEVLHENVVAPTLRLLSGKVGWSNVETAYRKALDEIGDDPADAITDAGTALQEALILCGARGNALGRLVTSAKKLGVLAAHDTTLTKGIATIIDWVAADRSERGDSHNAAPATPADAWLAVHIVGALIYRLAGDSPQVGPP